MDNFISRIIEEKPYKVIISNKQMQASNATLLTRYGLIKERTSALITDAIRANLLQYMEYDTKVIEFIDIEHSPKNILLRAVKRDSISDNKKRQLLDEVKYITNEFNIQPTLLKLLNL